MKEYSKILYIIPGIIIICYLSIGFIPNLSAVDKIAPQWLANTLKSTMSITYIGFILWASLSYFYAINPTEVIVNITRQANVLLMYLLMAIFLFSFKQKIEFVCWLVIIILGIEVYAILIEAQNMLNSEGIIKSAGLKGVTANRNITAFSVAIKIPFVLFLFELVKLLFSALTISNIKTEKRKYEDRTNFDCL